MVDDLITASKFGKQVIQTNSVVNKFDKLSKTKCAIIHAGQTKCEQCLKSKANNEPIKESQKEKYLGDYMNNLANSQTTIQDRKQKGYGILSKMYAILKNIP